MVAHRPVPFRAPRPIVAVALLSAAAGIALGAARPQTVRSAAAPSMDAAKGPAVDHAPAAAPVPAAAEGRLGAYVAVADGCSYYPLTTCGGAVLHVSESTPGMLTNFAGLEVRVELTTAVCGSGIAGQPLEGPVVTRVEVAGPCGPPLAPQACPKLAGKVPDVVVQAALADPSAVLGWGERCNPAVPLSPANPRKSRLTLLNPNVPFHPTLNGVVFKCGCP